MDIRKLRLANQHIARPVFDDAADVVRWLGAVQAQDYLGALWALGIRSRRTTEASVEAAIARRAIIRTWPMRGTLHFVAADDARWMLPLLTPRVIASTASRYRGLGLDDAVFARSARVAEKAMAGGACVRRDRMYELWNDAGIATHESRGLHLLGYLAQTGLICFGPRDGKQHTFALLDEWLAPTPSVARDEALGRLAERYFTSHGPASVHDFAWWSGLTITECRAAIERVVPMLEREEIGGRPLWFRRGAAQGRGTDKAHLLPAWDEYTVAYRDRTDVLEAKHATKVNAGGGVLKPVVVIRGEVVGSWQRTLVKGRALVRLALFARVERADMDAIARATVKYGEFIGLPAELVR